MKFLETPVPMTQAKEERNSPNHRMQAIADKAGSGSSRRWAGRTKYYGNVDKAVWRSRGVPRSDVRVIPEALSACPSRPDFFFDQSPHSLGLYGALGSRYRAWGRPINEAIIWSELTPFLLMDQSGGIEALAEYAVFQERPNEARTGWLRDRINLSFRSYHDKSVIAATSIALMNGVAWCDLLEPSVLRLIEDEAG